MAWDFLGVNFRGLIKMWKVHPEFASSISCLILPGHVNRTYPTNYG